MKFLAWFSRGVLALLLCASLSGCFPQSQGQLEEEKEPHFIEGKRAVNSMDWEGAINEFEKDLEANSRNASAHFELGWLYEEKEPDSAAAIYHYEQFLKLRPNADTAEAVRQRIVNCKQDLAKAVLPLPAAPGVQRDLELLIQTNKQLLAEVEQWRAYFKAQQTNRPALSSISPLPVQPVQAQPPPTNPAPIISGADLHARPRPTGARTCVVQAGETLAAISRRYNVKLDALTAANPGIDAKKLRVGQTVNIP